MNQENRSASYRRCCRWGLIFFLSLIIAVWGFPGYPDSGSETPVGAKDRRDARQLVETGRAHFDTGRFAEAADSLEAAAQIFEAQADWSALAATLMNLGRVQFSRGQLDAALQSWQSAAALYRNPLDVPDQVLQSQVYQAQAQQGLGLYLQACQTLTGALGVDSTLCSPQEDLADALETLDQPSDMDRAQVEGWRTLAEVLRQMGRLQDSLALLEPLLQVADAPATQAPVELTLANTYQALGDRERDRNFPQQFDVMPWRCQTSPELSEAARDYYQRSEQAYRAVEASSGAMLSAKAQLNRLRLMGKTGQVAAAAELVQKIPIGDLPPDRTRIYGRIQMAQSQVCVQDQRPQAPPWQQAAQQVALALQEAEALGDKRAQSYAQGSLGGLYEYRAWWLAARRQPQQAQSWRQQAWKLTNAALYQAQPGEFADIAYRWQWQQGRLLQALGDKAAAIRAYEAAINTLESVREDLLAINSDVQFSFRDNVEPVYRGLVALLLSDQSEAPDLTDLQRVLEDSLYYVESLQLAELENFLQCSVESLGGSSFSDSSGRRLSPAVLTRRIDQVVQSDASTALIYPILLQDRIAIIAKLPGQALQYHATLVDHETVESTLNQLQAYLRDPTRTNAIRQLSSQVYGWLIQPFEEAFDIAAEREASPLKNLVFVLDGSLRNVPMSMLYDGQRQRYLLERYSIAISSGLQLLDPKPQPVQVQALVGGLSERREFGGKTFSALVNVPAEVASIQAVVPGQSLLDADFNREALRSQLQARDYSVVHMATHGNFSSDPEETYLVLSDQQLQASDLNDLLRVETAGGPGQIGLLVLSACETATGDKRAALGLAGLALRAGARSTLATLWQVNDASTTALMSQFYANLNSHPAMTKAEALRQAQLSLWENTDQDWGVPFFWAAYVLVGNWF